MVQENDRTVRVFRHSFALEDAIGSHVCLLEALPCVWSMAFLSGDHTLTVATINYVQTLKAQFEPVKTLDGNNPTYGFAPSKVTFPKATASLQPMSAFLLGVYGTWWARKMIGPLAPPKQDMMYGARVSTGFSTRGVLVWDSRCLLGLKLGYSCDPIARLSSVPFSHH